MRQKYYALDALTALTVVVHATGDTLLYIATTATSKRKHWTCMTHLEQYAYLLRQPKPGYRRPIALRLSPINEVDRIIARADIEDFMRSAKWRLFAHQPTSDADWTKCPHCRRYGRSFP